VGFGVIEENDLAARDFWKCAAEIAAEMNPDARRSEEEGGGDATEARDLARG
jgi:hypothetical protein